MKLRIILSSVLALLLVAGVTLQQLSGKPHHHSVTVSTSTTSTVSTSTTTGLITTTTNHGGTTSSPATTTTSQHSPPIVNPPIVIGGSANYRTTCPLITPFVASPPTTTSSPTTTTSESSSTTTIPETTTTTTTILPISSSTTTTTKAAVRSCTVLQVGDSLGWGRGHAMQDKLSRNNWIHFYTDDRGSTGLSDLAFYNWITAVRDDLNQYHPNLLIVSFGGNDAQGLSGGGVSENFGTARWKRIYASRVHAVLALAAARHCGVLWLGMPISSMDYFNHLQLIISDIYSHEVAASTNSVYIPLWTTMSKRQRFTWTARVNGAAVTLHGHDGIHPSGWGYAVEATYVINQMKLIYRTNLVLSAPAYITGY